MGDAGKKFGKALFAAHRPGKFMEAKAAEKEADRNRKDAERFRQEGMDMAGRLNWEPDYVSDLVQPYQKAQSPVARSFLESLLTGSNPSMVSSTRHGGDRLRAGNQARFDEQFGGWDQLLARQRQIEQETPWAPKKFSAPAVQQLPPPPPQGPQEPPWMAAAKADPGGHTPEGNAALQQAWGFDDDYWKKLEEATGQRIDRADRTLRRG